MADTIQVMSARGDNRVALHELDPAHPGGEAFVAGNLVVEVAPTAFVNQRIREGELKLAGDADVKAFAEQQALAKAQTVAAVGDRQFAADQDRDRQLAAAELAVARANLARVEAEKEAIVARSKNFNDETPEPERTALARDAEDKDRAIEQAKVEVKAREKRAEATGAKGDRPRRTDDAAPAGERRPGAPAGANR